MALDRLLPATNAEPARWLASRIVGFATDVVSLVPGGFPAYGRVLHPATDLGGAPLRWDAVARATGRVAHRAMQWCAIAPSGDDAMRSIGIAAPPRADTLDSAVSERLVRVLARETTTPKRCYFAVWEGFGALLGEVRDAPAFDLPHRRDHPLTGAIGAWSDVTQFPPFPGVGPNLVWPEDRAWCVASEIDLDSTYLGATAPCVESLVSDADLEAYLVGSRDVITADGDALNRRTPP